MNIRSDAIKCCLVANFSREESPYGNTAAVVVKTGMIPMIFYVNMRDNSIDNRILRLETPCEVSMEGFWDPDGPPYISGCSDGRGMLIMPGRFIAVPLTAV